MLFFLFIFFSSFVVESDIVSTRWNRPAEFRNLYFIKVISKSLACICSSNVFEVILKLSVFKLMNEYASVNRFRYLYSLIKRKFLQLHIKQTGLFTVSKYAKYIQISFFIFTYKRLMNLYRLMRGVSYPNKRKFISNTVESKVCLSLSSFVLYGQTSE